MARVNWYDIVSVMQEWQEFCDDEMVNYSLSYSEGEGRWEMTASSCVATYNGYVRKAGSPVQAIEWMKEVFAENEEAFKQAHEMGPPRPRPEQIWPDAVREAAVIADRMLRTRVKCEVQAFSSRVCSRGTKGCEWIHKD